MREPEGIDVQEFEWDEWNIAHLSQHGVTPDKADEIRTVAPRFFHNLPDRAGTHVVIGPDSQQNFYYIVLRPMGRPGECDR